MRGEGWGEGRFLDERGMRIAPLIRLRPAAFGTFSPLRGEKEEAYSAMFIGSG